MSTQAEREARHDHEEWRSWLELDDKERRDRLVHAAEEVDATGYGTLRLMAGKALQYAGPNGSPLLNREDVARLRDEADKAAREGRNWDSIGLLGLAGVLESLLPPDQESVP